MVSDSDNQEGALEYIKCFAQPEVQQRWWELGGYPDHSAVLGSPDFPTSAPFAADFLEAMNGAQDVWRSRPMPTC